MKRLMTILLSIVSFNASAEAILNVEGQIQVNGQTVINSSGQWIGSNQANSDIITIKDYRSSPSGQPLTYLHYDFTTDLYSSNTITYTLDSNTGLMSENDIGFDENGAEVDRYTYQPTAVNGNTVTAIITETEGEEQIQFTEAKTTVTHLPNTMEVGKNYGMFYYLTTTGDGEDDYMRDYETFNILGKTTWALDSVPSENVPDVFNSNRALKYNDCILTLRTESDRFRTRYITYCKGIGKVEERRVEHRPGNDTRSRLIVLINAG
ncbi:hypothetical protein [Photobacterium satsumensis]|uniref:hypothetical protein n=1 Tax=Photobacterium satsumensis TaxID=2910239 RepID=UPI003D0E85A1